jgi:aspartate racemase
MTLMARGARAVVLGCTEIPLGIAAGPRLPFAVVDTVAALADAAIAWARGEAGLRLAGE